MRRLRKSQWPHIRILGADCTGKTEVCRALVEMAPEFVQFAATEPYVYDWLRTYGIGRSSTITPDQLGEREKIFLAANRVQMRAVKEVTKRQPLVAVRGRADTIITHGILRDRRLSNDMYRLSSEPYMRPDLLVVLTAPISVIAERLDARGEAKTGANSLSFHKQCQESYIEICNVATRYFPVAVYDTSDPKVTPSYIADQILGQVAVDTV